MGNHFAGKTKNAEVLHQNSASAKALSNNASVHPLLQLQQTMGNQGVQRLIQAKLQFGQPGDVFEQEAEGVAEQVMRMPEPAVQRQEEELDEEEIIQMKPVETIQPLMNGESRVGGDVEQGLAASKGGGSPLPGTIRAFMEPRFGADFGKVRVHTGSEATHLNRNINAQAFTHGQDIYFNEGRYNPGTDSGKKLLAHELTHTIQQSGSSKRISRWGLYKLGTPHLVVTIGAFKKLKPDAKKFYTKRWRAFLAIKSDFMDLRPEAISTVKKGKAIAKRHIKNKSGMFRGDLTKKEKEHLEYIGLTPKEIKKEEKDIGKDYDNMVGYSRDPDEAFNHAEGGLYKYKGGMPEAHKRKVDDYINQAVIRWTPAVIKLAKMYSLDDDVCLALHNLALALHVAEDRGSHGDGASGTGHDPRRIIKPPKYAKEKDYYDENWKNHYCDKKGTNSGGYGKAVEYGKDVLEKFYDRVSGKGKGTLEKLLAQE